MIKMLERFRFGFRYAIIHHHADMQHGNIYMQDFLKLVFAHSKHTFNCDL